MIFLFKQHFVASKLKTTKSKMNLQDHRRVGILIEINNTYFLWYLVPIDSTFPLRSHQDN